MSGYEDGDAWAAGPERVYGRLAAAAVGLIEDDLAGQLALDAGAGTGAAGRELVRRGAAVVSVDRSAAMLQRAGGVRVVGDVLRLPLRTGSVGVTVASLVLSHVDDPAAALRELARVTRPGGPVCVTAFPYGVGHPVKQAADQVLATHGYRAPGWYTALKTTGEQRVGRPADLVALAGAAGLRDPVVRPGDVDLGGLDADALVAWRLGMAQVAGWLSGLDRQHRAQIAAEVAASVAARPGGTAPLPLLVLIGRGG